MGVCGLRGCQEDEQDHGSAAQACLGAHAHVHRKFSNEHHRTSVERCEIQMTHQFVSKGPEKHEILFLLTPATRCS
jgi:hypothetical protein